ncbi:helix-turn-helix transcriptional regulator [Runella slithyformis]|uniref:Helix-turn-helix domain protein n=1 Tax=Runella slithyformis (strain ATCC 29530 / DSM 19594 / LMG 11500 / NCIMB 11436 / LSU 4) TaxID=761193 RepID=A0A7U3ZHD1_RUNSL|nr:helix-turn-helix transcriptional regulator [Runella slithyformis]AEI47210.1 helix-turn-helix domain protein [Runella slithyformis DSM 19594]
MRAPKINPELSKYAGVLSEHDKRAKEFLEKVGLPPQILEAQAAKVKAAELCETLKQHRQRHHLTQTELADKVGMQKEFISRIENGKVDVQLSTFLKIIESLGLKVMVTE